MWLLRFAPDGSVADFEEWAYWPGAVRGAGRPALRPPWGALTGLVAAPVAG